MKRKLNQGCSRMSLLLVLLTMSCARQGEDGKVRGHARNEDQASRFLAAPPAGPGAMAPELTVGSSGVFLSWLEPFEEDGRRAYALRLARLDGETWGEAHEAVRGEGFFANWADRPAVVAADGELFTHWLEKLGDDTYAYGVQVARSSDGGGTWTRAGLLHDDASPTEHGFVSWVPSPDGLHAFWLDGRAMVEGGPMELRSALIAGDLPPSSTLLDDRVCECCATDAALTSAGPVVVYRDRDGEEVRDIGVIRASEDGWSAPTVLADDGWRIEGCPVNGPAIAARGERVVVAWFTVRGGHSRVQIAFSEDAGATFAEPLPVDLEDPLGRVDVELDEGGRAHVSWLGRADDAAEIRVQSVASSGERGAVRVVAATSQARSAGVPRLVLDGSRLLVAWVEAVEPSRLRVASLGVGG